jgi:hypothetical protein
MWSILRGTGADVGRSTEKITSATPGATPRPCPRRVSEPVAALHANRRARSAASDRFRGSLNLFE